MLKIFVSYVDVITLEIKTCRYYYLQDNSKLITRYEIRGKITDRVRCSQIF